MIRRAKGRTGLLSILGLHLDRLVFGLAVAVALVPAGWAGSVLALP